MIDGWGISSEMAFRWTPLDLTAMSTLVQVMAWCRQSGTKPLPEPMLTHICRFDINRPQPVKYCKNLPALILFLNPNQDIKWTSPPADKLPSHSKQANRKRTQTWPFPGLVTHMPNLITLHVNVNGNGLGWSPLTGPARVNPLQLK